MTSAARCDVFDKIVKRMITLNVMLTIYNRLFPNGETDYACQLAEEMENALKNHQEKLTNGDN